MKYLERRRIEEYIEMQDNSFELSNENNARLVSAISFYHDDPSCVYLPLHCAFSQRAYVKDTKKKGGKKEEKTKGAGSYHAPRGTPPDRSIQLSRSVSPSVVTNERGTPLTRNTLYEPCPPPPDDADDRDD